MSYIDNIAVPQATASQSHSAGMDVPRFSDPAAVLPAHHFLSGAIEVTLLMTFMFANSLVFCTIVAQAMTA